MPVSKYWPSTQSAFGPVPVVPQVRTNSHTDGIILQDPVTYSETILATEGLAGYWKLSEPSGTLVADFSGRGYDLTTSGSPTRNFASIVPALTDPCTDFNGSTQYANRSAVFIDQNPTAMTLECWIDGDTTGNKCPLGIFGSSSDKSIWLNFQNFIQLYGSLDGSAQTTCQSSVSTVIGTIYHVVGTFDGSNLRLYVNGTLVGGPTALAGSLHTATTAGSLAIGRLGAISSDFFDGRVDEAAVYTRVLTSTEIANHYALGSAANVSYTTPVAALTFTPQAPTLSTVVSLTTPVAALTFTPKTPTITTVVSLTSPVAALTFGPQAPTITVAGSLTTPLASLVFGALAPTMSSVVSLTTPLAGITFTALAPTSATGVSYTTPLANLTFSPLAPTMAIASSLTTPLAALTFSAKTPTLTTAASLTTPLAGLTFSAKVPALTTAASLTTPLGALVFSAKTPTMSSVVSLTTPVAALVFTPLTPSTTTGISYTTPVGSLVFTPLTPSLLTAISATTPLAALIFSPLTPSYTNIPSTAYVPVWIVSVASLHGSVSVVPFGLVTLTSVHSIQGSVDVVAYRLVETVEID